MNNIIRFQEKENKRMTRLQKVQLEQSKTREDIAGILDKDERTDADNEMLSTLTKRSQALELDTRAAIVADGDDKTITTQTIDTETRELDGLIQRSDVGTIFDAALDGRVTDGATRELQDHFGMNSNHVPLALIQRAFTPVPGEIGANQNAIIPAVFPMSSASWAGVDMPTVPVGQSIYTVMDTDTVASDYNAGTSVSETTGAFTANVLEGRRVQASFFYRREDRAKLAGLDSALRQNLSDALSSGIDKYILTKANTGLLEFGTDPTASTAEEAFASYRKVIYAAVDGRYAGDTSGVRILVGPATYAHMASKYRSNTADDSVLDSIMRISGGVRASAHVPDAVSTVQQAVVIRGMEYKHAVAPLWDGVEVITDNVTKAATGEIVLTAVLLMNFKVVRAAGYTRYGLKIA